MEAEAPRLAWASFLILFLARAWITAYRMFHGHEASCYGHTEYVRAIDAMLTRWRSARGHTGVEKGTGGARDTCRWKAIKQTSKNKKQSSR